MTISTEVRKAGPFIGNDSASVFPFAFKVFKAADLIVVRRQDNIGEETTLVLDSDYHVTLNGNQDTTPGGVVTLVAGALASGFTLVASSELPYLQPTDLTNQGGFYPKVITNALDRLTIFCQQLAEITGRTLKLPITAPTNISAEIPLPNPSELIAWDETGTKLTTISPQSLVTSIAYGSATADLFAGDGVTTTFPLSTNPASVNNLDVSVGGFSQRPVQGGIGDYSWNGGASITFTSPPPAPSIPGDKNVLVRYMQAIPVSNSEALHAQTREALRRSYAEAGHNLVDGSFETGGTLTSTSDVLLLESEGAAYAWTGSLPKIVAPGFDPVGAVGFELRTNVVLRDELSQPSGSSLIGHGAETVSAKLDKIDLELGGVTTPTDVGMSESAVDNGAAIAAIESITGLAMPVHALLREFNASSFNGITSLVGAKILSGGFVRVPGIYPELLGGRYAAAYNGGGQLAALNVALNDPSFQDFGITFIGDSITNGTGSTGHSALGARDGTLSDPRNNAASCSYVNEFRRWLKDRLGSGTTEVLSNHPYSPSGESISTFSRSDYAFPKGKKYAFAKTGIASGEIKESRTGPYLNARREITVNGGGTGSLSFTMTGDSFTLIFGGLANGAKYELRVNDSLIGTYSSRVGDDGIVALTNQRRKHTFPYVKNGNITIKVIHYTGEATNNAIYIEGFMFERVIRVKNQGIIGATTGSYLTYNFPTSVSAGIVKKLTEQTAWTETTFGTGNTSLTVSAAPNSLTGQQRRYGFLSTSGWELTYTIPAGNDRVIVGYSSLDNTGAVEVYADGVLAGTIHTSSLYQGNIAGYAKTQEVTIPLTATSIKLKTVYEILTNASTCYLYLEGVGHRNSSTVSYPDNNSFNDGVCLDVKDAFAFFQLGINDRGSSRVLAPDEISANLATMISLMPTFCRAIFMVSNPAITSVAHKYSSAAVRNAIASSARDNAVDFIDNHALFGDCPLRYYTTDNLHPNDVGHALIARNITNSIINAAT